MHQQVVRRQGHRLRNLKFGGGGGGGGGVGSSAIRGASSSSSSSPSHPDETNADAPPPPTPSPKHKTKPTTQTRFTPDSKSEEWSSAMTPAFPDYMRSTQTEELFCEDVRESEHVDATSREEDLSGDRRRRNRRDTLNGDVTIRERRDTLWSAIKAEVRRDAEAEPMLSSFLYSSILDNSKGGSLEQCISRILANRMQSVTLLATQLNEIFQKTYQGDPNVRTAMRADLKACRERDPACKAYSDALLYSKGFHALQAHRASHALWTSGRKDLALMLQSRISEVFSVDIHPGARIGKGILMDHGMGVVIGETAVIGDRVSILQGVTLGGTGKEGGDRHPKVGSGVLIGPHATILGNISIGDDTMIAACSLVLKDVRAGSMVAGSPARVVAQTMGTPSERMVQEIEPVSEKSQQSFCEWWQDAVKEQVEEQRRDGKDASS
ncbi:serine acetyltransferase [Pseudoscourfieldia marina]